MNNYCTNCGSKLKTYDVVCNECKTPIPDIPFDYKHTPPKTKKRNKKIISISFITIMIIAAFFLLRFVYIKTTSEILKKKYVIPFLEERYGKYYSNLEFDMYGKCIISGDCYTEPLIECDGNGCEVYKYLSRFKCMSFYYDYEIYGEEKTVSVYKKNGKYHIVGGRNIYGYDDEYSDKYLDNYDEYYDTKHIFIKNLPYESEYYSLNERLSYTFEVQDKNEINFTIGSDLTYFLIDTYDENALNIKVKIKKFDNAKNEINTYNIELNEFNSFLKKINKQEEKYIKIYIGDNYE